ncbi:MAG TPA: DUF4327 family protein [Oculatellaceae cyanobacterium]|jgi:hypothetical protein
MIANTITCVRYSLDVIKEEVNYLLNQGVIYRQQRIYILLEHFPARDWNVVESELEENGYLLRDRIGDLLACEQWTND